MTLILSDGIPEVYINHNHKLKADTGRIADGNWHHIAVSIPKKSCTLSEIDIVVDKKAVTTVRTGKYMNIFEHIHGRMVIGGFGSTTVRKYLKSRTGTLQGLKIYYFSLFAKPIPKTNRFKTKRDYECIKVEGDEPNLKIMPNLSNSN